MVVKKKNTKYSGGGNQACRIPLVLEMIGFKEVVGDGEGYPDPLQTHTHRDTQKMILKINK